MFTLGQSYLGDYESDYSLVGRISLSGSIVENFVSLKEGHSIGSGLLVGGGRALRDEWEPDEDVALKVKNGLVVTITLPPSISVINEWQDSEEEEEAVILAALSFYDLV